MKITEISIYPTNENPVHEHGTVEGPYNVLNPMFEARKKQLGRKKQDYIFKIEDAPANFYAYNLINSNFESYKKYIDLTKTW